MKTTTHIALTITFAQYRDSTIALPTDSRTLHGCWHRSRMTLANIRNQLSNHPLPDTVQTIYVCGSLGRMEQLPASDCDLVIVTDESGSDDVVATVWDRLESLGLHRPKLDGIFSQPVTRAALIDPSTRGLVDEDQFVFGKRIQLLLDSQPLYRDDVFEQLTADVLNRYAYPHAATVGTSVWAGLLSDLVRYYRALSIRTMWLLEDPLATWQTLNVKLRYSRLVLYAGLLFLLADSPRDATNPIAWLQPRLKWTPLERLAAAFQSANLNRFHTIAAAYDRFLTAMADDSLEQPDTVFAELIQHSTTIGDELVQCLLARYKDSHTAFLRELLFL